MTQAAAAKPQVADTVSTDEAGLPAELSARLAAQVPALPDAGRTLLEPETFERAMALAEMMSKAKGLPGMFMQSPGTCLAAIDDGLRLNVSPFVVARNCYQVNATAARSYYGKFVAAVINTSPEIDGLIDYEHFGDWSKVRGKFRMVESAKKKDEHDRPVKYAAPAWKDADEEGIGVRAFATLKKTGEVKTLELFMTQCWPRNSTLWAQDPEQQICYVAARRWADRFVPHVLMGMMTDGELAGDMIDVTPAEPAPALAAPDKAGKAQTGTNKLDAFVTANAGAKASGTPQDAGGAADGQSPAPSGDRPATAAAATTADATEPDLLTNAETLPAEVALFIPGQKRPQTLALAAASATLLNHAKECAGDKGAEWLRAAIRANPWTAQHRPTAEGLREAIEACLTGN